MFVIVGDLTVFCLLKVVMTIIFKNHHVEMSLQLGMFDILTFFEWKFEFLLIKSVEFFSQEGNLNLWIAF